MKVVITGGNGLIGRYVVSELTRSGLTRSDPTAPAHSVTVLDRQRRRAAPGRVEQILGSHANMDDLLRAFAGADAVLHLSALQPTSSPSEDVLGQNVQGTLNVFNAAAQCGVRRVVNWSSVWALGWSTPGNTFVPDYLPIDEAHPLRAADPYGRSKIEGEAIAASFHGRDGLETMSLRPAFTATRATLESLWGTKGVRSPAYSHLSYVDARDQAVAARLALECRTAGHVIVYLAANDSRVAEPLNELLPRLNPEIGDRARQLTGTKASISNQQAAALLGWEPEHSWRNLTRASRVRGVVSAALRSSAKKLVRRGSAQRQP